MVAVAAQIPIFTAKPRLSLRGDIASRDRGESAHVPRPTAKRSPQKSLRCFGFRIRIASDITAGVIVRRRSFEALREEVAMIAVQVVKYGDAVEGIELREVPEPAAPKPGEVLVGVEFSPINFNDLMVVRGIYAWRPELPATMGTRGPAK